jgi:hypothetical protein
MKKVPCPDVLVGDDGKRTVVTLEWDTFRLQMFEDEAVRLARTIYDVLEGES